MSDETPHDDRPRATGEDRYLYARDLRGQPTRPSVTVDPDFWARGVFHALAVTLAEPLRKAYRDHVDEHGCGCPGDRWCKDRERHETNGGHAVPGIAYCPEGVRLFRLLPDFDQVIVA